MTSAARYTAIFGGAFDPFHNGHVAAIKLLLTLPSIERVLVVPSGDRPDKRGVSPALERFEATRRGVESVFGGDPRIVVSDLQSSGAVGFATIDLVLYAKKEFASDVAVVIGHELLGDLPKWHRADELKNIAKFLVLERPGVCAGISAAAPPDGWRVEFLPPFGALGVEVSSTELRARLAAGDKCEGLIPATTKAAR
jgi:nicotinate-nucleotide adenylyltransferase